MIKRLAVLLVIIYLIFSFSLSVFIPENPNYNYITLNSGTEGVDFQQNSSVFFYISATGYTHNFTIISSCEDSNDLGLLIFQTGLPSNFTFVNQTFIDSCIMPNLSSFPEIYNIPLSISNQDPNITINWSETFMSFNASSDTHIINRAPSGYYVFVLENLEGSGKYHDIININYKNNYFLIK